MELPGVLGMEMPGMGIWSCQAWECGGARHGVAYFGVPNTLAVGRATLLNARPVA